MNDPREPILISVFPSSPDGGNPAPIVLDASGMSDADMQQVARSHGHESGFVLPPPPGADCDFEFRFWVPNHEMSMCGHATLGAIWLLGRAGRLRSDRISILTKSGMVEAVVRDRMSASPVVEISQPAGIVKALGEDDFDRAELLDILRIKPSQLADLPVQNAATSRTKTLIPMADVDALTHLAPDFDRMRAFCESIDSTGLYPYATIDAERQIFDARQFPSSSGYPEDAATGIAASALTFGLLANGMVRSPELPITVNQGRAMRRPSRISVRLNLEDGQVTGCWLGGEVRLEQ